MKGRVGMGKTGKDAFIRKLARDTIGPIPRPKVIIDNKNKEKIDKRTLLDQWRSDDDN